MRPRRGARWADRPAEVQLRRLRHGRGYSDPDRSANGNYQVNNAMQLV